MGSYGTEEKKNYSTIEYLRNVNNFLFDKKIYELRGKSFLLQIIIRKSLVTLENIEILH